MDKLITYDEMKAALEGCVAERGADFVYPEEWKFLDKCGDKTCQYVNEDGTPSCIIGMAVMKNWPHIKLEEGTGAEDIFRYFAEEDAIHLASECQGRQDAGCPWGQALKYAIFTTEEEYEQD